MKELRYVYFGDRNGKTTHKGVVSVGYCHNKLTGKMEYSVAFCSPNDRFVKSKAHRILAGRHDHGVIQESKESYKIPPAFKATIVDIIALFKAGYYGKTEASAYNYRKLGLFACIAIPRWCQKGLVSSNK